MKLSKQVLLFVCSGASWLGPTQVDARCSFSYQEGAEDSKMNPHLLRRLGQRRPDGPSPQQQQQPPPPPPPGPSPSLPPPPPPFPLRSIRSIDGEETLGTAFAVYIRRTFADYADGMGSMKDAPNARAVSNAVLWDNHIAGPSTGISDMFWQWGQFLDHDLDLNEGHDVFDTAHIECPSGDLLCGTGEFMTFIRSNFTLDNSNVRQQLNFITSVIDGSGVYGSDATREAALRGNGGRMDTSAGNLLPLNEYGLDNAGGSNDETLFLAGDIRSNEQVGLLTMHTLFVREHNRLVGRIRKHFPDANSGQVYQLARKLVGAEIQAITYREFLPILLGNQAPKARDYQFNPSVDTRIANEFSTMAYRFGHSMISPTLILQDSPGSVAELPLRDAFFAVDLLKNDDRMIEKIAGGLINTPAQRLDHMINDDIRDFLFGEVGEGGFDLGALNIQRGRDHGLPNYNAMRTSLGLSPKTSFADINPDPNVVSRLQAAYDSVDDIDGWVGGLSEPPIGGGLVGELFSFILKDQFERLMHGDPLFYAGDADVKSQVVRDHIVDVERFSLADLIRRNTRLDVPGSAKVMQEPGTFFSQ